jgi:tRNA modification GTPase
MGDRVRDARGRLLDWVAAAEALLDHGDDGSEEPDPDGAVIASLAAELRGLVALGENLERRSRGPTVVIAGRVNSGKSSIFNKLCEYDRSIVSPLPGTTRDYVAEHSWVSGSLVNLVDTAGLRESRDPIEQEGIRRSRSRILESDVLVLVIDGSEPAGEADLQLVDEFRAQRPVVVLSKSDLPCRVDRAALERRYPEIETLKLSTREPDGCRKLARVIARRCQETGQGGEGIAPNLRHRRSLAAAAAALEGSAGLLGSGAPLDLAVAELHRALSALREIIGEDAGEEVLERIFSRFCIGK